MIECFFDCSSPWTYLAFHNLQTLAAELGVTVHWRPILVGGIFNSVNPSVYASRDNPVPAKRDYLLKDLQDWARQAGLRINMPPTVFPVNSVKAMRACVWLQQARGDPHMLAFARAVFEAYWAHDQDISQDTSLGAIAQSVGLDGQALLAGAAQAAIKEALKTHTAELISRGGFGSPTLFVAGQDMYFGNDRLPLVRAAVQRRLAAAAR